MPPIARLKAHPPVGAATAYRKNATSPPSPKTATPTTSANAGAGLLLLHDQGATRLFVEVIVKFVASGFQGPHIDDALAVGGDHLFDPQRFAFKLHGLGVEILEANRDRFVGRGAQFARLELALGIAQLKLRRLLRLRRRYWQHRDCAKRGQGQSSHCDHHSRPLSAFPGLRKDQNSTANLSLARLRWNSARLSETGWPTSRPQT